MYSIVKNNACLYLCSQCGSLIYGISVDADKQDGMGINVNCFQFADDFPATFEAVRHIWHQNRIVDICDNVPKFIDAPKEQGGR